MGGSGFSSPLTSSNFASITPPTPPAPIRVAQPQASVPATETEQRQNLGLLLFGNSRNRFQDSGSERPRSLQIQRDQDRRNELAEERRLKELEEQKRIEVERQRLVQIQREEERLKKLEEERRIQELEEQKKIEEERKRKLEESRKKLLQEQEDEKRRLKEILEQEAIRKQKLEEERLKENA